MKNKIVTYFPSFLTRYAIQFLIVALPWVLQSKGKNLSYVGSILVFYNLGSLLMGIWSVRFIHKLNTKLTIVIAASLQGVLCLGSLLFSLSDFMILFMFFQGICLGLLRPVSKIWILELTHKLKKNDVVKKVAASEVVTALGMALGSTLGSFANNFLTNPRVLLFYSSLCLLIPIIILNFTILRFNSKTLTNLELNPSNSFLEILNWLKNDKLSLGVLAIYLMSITIFKIWIVSLPFLLRLDKVSFSESYIVLLLGIHPIVFMLGQIIFSHLCSKFKFKEMQIFLLISLSCLIQAIFVGLAVFSNSKLIVSALVLIGGGFVAAATYPLCIHISESHMLKKGPIFQRQLFLALALCADLGQLVGGLLLSLVGKFTQNGQFALSIPIVIVLFITFSYFFKSEREVTNV